MRAFTSVLCISALALTRISGVAGAGFADLLRPLIGGESDGGGGGLMSILGPVSVVSGDFVNVDTKVGSPTTVIDKGVAPKGGLSISGPNFVKVKTDVDSETTEIRTARSRAGPAPPAAADPEIALALSKPRPSSVAAVTTAFSSIAESIFGRKGATPAPPAPKPAEPVVLPAASPHDSSGAQTSPSTVDSRPTDRSATPTPTPMPLTGSGGVSPPDTAPRSLRG